MVYFGEEGFSEWMEHEAEPYLKQYDRQGEFMGKKKIKNML
mgnify:CR=1 FL=1